MKTIAEFMTAGHKACDDKFALAEKSALANNWSEADNAFKAFHNATAQHFRIEEEVLFPALLSAGGPAGPVQVMRMEHAQMNGLFEQMAATLVRKDAQKYGGLSETLLVVMQQHNLKEEQILYAIADHVLASELESLLGRMQAV